MASVATVIPRITGEKSFVDTFVDGADDMVGVILIIAIARGASVLMQTTHLDNYIIYNAAELLRNVPAFVFTPLNYVLHVVLSILTIPTLIELPNPCISSLASAAIVIDVDLSKYKLSLTGEPVSLRKKISNAK